MVDLHFAQEISRLVHSQGGFEYIGIKTASQNVARDAHLASAAVADSLVEVIHKEAEYCTPVEFAEFIEKIARTLNYPYLAKEDKLKLASAMAVDAALDEAMQSGTADTEKLAHTKLYGREYILEVLRGVI